MTNALVKPMEPTQATRIAAFDSESFKGKSFTIYGISPEKAIEMIRDLFAKTTQEPALDAPPVES